EAQAARFSPTNQQLLKERRLRRVQMIVRTQNLQDVLAQILERGQTGDYFHTESFQRRRAERGVEPEAFAASTLPYRHAPATTPPRPTRLAPVHQPCNWRNPS